MYISKSVDILTKRGFLPIRDLVVGDICYGVAPGTLFPMYVEVTSKKAVTKTDCYNVLSGGFNIQFHADDNVLVSVSDKYGEYKEVESVVDAFNTMDRISLIRNGMAGGGVFKKRLFGFESQTFMKVLGFFLHRGGISSDTSLIQFSKKNKKILSKYRGLIKQLTGDSGTIYRNRDGVNVLRYGKKNKEAVRLSDTLVQFYALKANRRLPEFIWELDASLLSSLYEGFCEAGRASKISQQHSTVSKQMRDDLLRLSAHLGLSGTFCEQLIPAHRATVHGVVKDFIETTASVISLSKDKCINIRNRSKGNMMEYGKSKFFKLELTKKVPIYLRENTKMYLSSF